MPPPRSQVPAKEHKVLHAAYVAPLGKVRYATEAQHVVTRRQRFGISKRAKCYAYRHPRPSHEAGRRSGQTQREDEAQSLKLRIGQIKDRLNRLTDAYIDQAIDKTMFEERKKSLLKKQLKLKVLSLHSISNNPPLKRRVVFLF